MEFRQMSPLLIVVQRYSERKQARPKIKFDGLFCFQTMQKNRVHFSSKDYDIFNKGNALKSFAVFCQMKASIQFHIITIEDAVQALKIGKSTLYRHLAILKKLGYVSVRKNSIYLKGQLTKDAYKYNRFSLTKQQKRKENQPIHMSVHIGKNYRDTFQSLQGLKIVSNILAQEVVINKRLKASSKVKKVTNDKMTKRVNFGFMTLSNQRAAKILKYKTKVTGQKRLRLLQSLDYFKMKPSFIIIDPKSESKYIKDDLLMHHPAIKLRENTWIRQTPNQVSSIFHNHFGTPYGHYREQENIIFYAKTGVKLVTPEVGNIK